MACSSSTLVSDSVPLATTTVVPAADVNAERQKKQISNSTVGSSQNVLV